MKGNNICLVEVPGTEKTIDLRALFKLIRLGYDSELDSINRIAKDLDNTIRFIAENINENTEKEDLSAAFYLLYRLRDVFEDMEVKL